MTVSLLLGPVLPTLLVVSKAARAYTSNPIFVMESILLKDQEEGLQVLERAFGDQNRALNAQNTLLALRQKNQEF